MSKDKTVSDQIDALIEEVEVCYLSPTGKTIIGPKRLMIDAKKLQSLKRLPVHGRNEQTLEEAIERLDRTFMYAKSGDIDSVDVNLMWLRRYVNNRPNPPQAIAPVPNVDGLYKKIEQALWESYNEGPMVTNHPIDLMDAIRVIGVLFDSLQPQAVTQGEEVITKTRVICPSCKHVPEKHRELMSCFCLNIERTALASRPVDTAQSEGKENEGPDLAPIIKIMRSNKEHSLYQVGLTPRTNFKGSQEDHDNQLREDAERFQKAIDILSSQATKPITAGEVDDENADPIISHLREAKHLLVVRQDFQSASEVRDIEHALSGKKNNVFIDLGFDQDEAGELKTEADKKIYERQIENLVSHYHHELAVMITTKNDSAANIKTLLSEFAGATNEMFKARLGEGKE